MIFRKAKLKKNLIIELDNEKPDLNKILKYIDEYEIENVKTINKLKRKRKLDIRRINGAIKQTINAHGPISKDLIGSASKRIYGALLEDKKENIILKFFKWILKK